jgi:VanZ family protein
MINLLEKHRIVSLILTILAATEIFFFSEIVSAPGKKGIIPFSIIYHFVIFFLFSFFLCMTIKGNRKIKVKDILIVLLVSLIYAISDEIHQSFIPGRDASIKDILTDLTGSITSMIIVHLYSRKKHKKD